MASDQEDLALLLQETMEDLKTQRQQNVELFEENKKISEKLTQLIAATQSTADSRRTIRLKARVEVSLQTRVSLQISRLSTIHLT